MSILDVTEDQIFQTLGKGRDPNFKPIEKVRPAIVKPKKTCSINQNVRAAPAAKVTQPLEQVVKPEIIVASPQNDDSVKRLTEDLNELNNRVNGIQKMVKWYVIPQSVVVMVLIIAIVVKANS
jgi:hypothetical protein